MNIQHLTENEIAHVLITIETNGKLDMLSNSTLRTFANYRSSKRPYRRDTALRKVMAVLQTCKNRQKFDPTEPLPFFEDAPVVAALLEADAARNARTILLGRKQVGRVLSEAQNSKCCYCHGLMVKAIGNSQYTIEHLVERCNGGTDAMENLMAACQPCNNMRGALMRPVPEFYLFRQHLIEMWPPCTVPDVKWLRTTRLLMAAHTKLKEDAAKYDHVPPKAFLQMKALEHEEKV